MLKMHQDPRILFTIRSVAWLTGSDVSPPGGETAPIAVSVPSLSSIPRQFTFPALSHRIEQDVNLSMQDNLLHQASPLDDHSSL